MTLMLFVTSSTGVLTKTMESPLVPNVGHAVDICPGEVSWMCVVSGIIWKFKPAPIVMIMLKRIDDGELVDLISDQWAMDLVDDGWRP
jgi:hypothetical protein